jgi:hypothetical protein
MQLNSCFPRPIFYIVTFLKQVLSPIALGQRGDNIAKVTINILCGYKRRDFSAKRCSCAKSFSSNVTHTQHSHGYINIRDTVECGNNSSSSSSETARVEL